MKMSKYFDEDDIRFFKFLVGIGATVSLVLWIF